jgi:hypothetical protein
VENMTWFHFVLFTTQPNGRTNELLRDQQVEHLPLISPCPEETGRVVASTAVIIANTARKIADRCFLKRI